jgi:hypothetical protein
VGFLQLNLYEHPSGVAFDPVKVIDRAKDAFPEANFVPEEQGAAKLQRIEAIVAELQERDPTRPYTTVLESDRRSVRQFGPIYTFFIPLPHGRTARATASSADVLFHFEGSLPESMRQRILTFFRDLGVGWVKAEKGRGSEILEDLRGKSDCLRADVPWAS